MAWFVGVVAVSVDRFLTIHLHLRYQELVTHRRVPCVPGRALAVTISMWGPSVRDSFLWYCSRFRLLFALNS